MNLRIPIILTYLILFLWIWMGAAIREDFSRETAIGYAPMWGFILTAWVLVRLEGMARQAAKRKAESDSDDRAQKPPGVERGP